MDHAVQLRHRLDRNVHLHVQQLGGTHVDDLALSPWPHQEARHLGERGLRRRQPDPLRLAAAFRTNKRIEALQRQRQVRPPLGGGHRVDLVHDHPLGACQHLPRARGQHQVQRLRGRDQDVRRLFEHPLTIALGGVAGADPHPDVHSGGVGWVGTAGSGDALQRRPQVALDVVGERLQRRHVHQARVALGGGFRRQAIKPPQERRQRLARAGRRRHQHVFPARDRRPSLRLRRGRLRESSFEPLTHPGGEGKGGGGRGGERHSIGTVGEVGSGAVPPSGSHTSTWRG